MPAVITLTLAHPKIPGLIAHQRLTPACYLRFNAGLNEGRHPLLSIFGVCLASDSVHRLWSEIQQAGESPEGVVFDVDGTLESPTEPERPTSRMVMWNQVSGHELQFDMTADEMLEWQKLRRDGVNQYEALLHVMHRNEGVRKRIELHQKEAENYLREGRTGGISIVARPRVETRVVSEEEWSEQKMSSSSTSTASTPKPTEAELLKQAAVVVKELFQSPAVRDFCALTLQFAKVHLSGGVDIVSIKVPQVDKTGAPSKPVEAGKLGSLAHALALINSLPLPKAVKQKIADATQLGRAPTTPDALSAARSLVQSQLVKKPGSPLSAPASASPVAASPPVVEQVAEQQAVAAAVGKKRKSVDRTPAQSPVAASVATSPEKKASSPKKRQKTSVTDVETIPVGVVPLHQENTVVAKGTSPKVRKTPSGGPKRSTASVTSVGGSEAVATQLAAGLVGASSASGGDDWSHLDAMQC